MKSTLEARQWKSDKQMKMNFPWSNFSEVIIIRFHYHSWHTFFFFSCCCSIPNQSKASFLCFGYRLIKTTSSAYCLHVLMLNLNSPSGFWVRLRWCYHIVRLIAHILLPLAFRLESLDTLHIGLNLISFKFDFKSVKLMISLSV